jgi:hypothetical protein
MSIVRKIIENNVAGDVPPVMAAPAFMAARRNQGRVKLRFVDRLVNHPVEKDGEKKEKAVVKDDVAKVDSAKIIVKEDAISASPIIKKKDDEAPIIPKNAVEIDVSGNELKPPLDRYGILDMILGKRDPNANVGTPAQTVTHENASAVASSMFPINEGASAANLDVAVTSLPTGEPMPAHKPGDVRNITNVYRRFCK